MTALRRVAVSLTALAAAAAPFVVVTPPAHAAIESPSGGDTVSSQPVIAGRQEVDGRRSVDNVTVTLTPAGGGSPVTAVGCASSCGTAGTFSAAFEVARNGTYTAVATATHTSRGPLDPAASKSGDPVTFGVEIAPAAPRRLVAQPDGGTRTVTLSWSPNGEPDLLGYQVSRSVDGGVFEAAGNVDATKTTFVDDAGDGGNLAYQVVAFRRGATASSIVASTESNTATATVDRVAPPTSASGGGTSGDADAASGGAGTGTTGGGASGAGGTDADPGTDGALRPQASSAPVRITPGARLDLSGYKPNAAPLTIGPAPTPDTGYKDTLPYQPRAARDATASGTDNPTVASDEPALPVGSIVTTTESNRRALLTFLAGAMLLFMLSMHLRWLLRRTAPVAG